MRYRPMGPSGAIVSVISLNLTPDASRPRPSDWVAFVYAALESGVCTFEVAANDPVVIDGLSQALTAIDRRLVSVAWKIGRNGAGARDLSPVGLKMQIQAAVARTGLEYLDAIVIDDPDPKEIWAETARAFDEAKASGAVRHIGMAGEGDGIDELITRGGFDFLVTEFNITSGWRERNRLRAAAARDIAVIGRQPYPRTFHASVTAAKAGKNGRGREPLADCGTYAFLDATHGWSAEEICVAYALTEPALASVQVESVTIDQVERLSAVTEREMPPGVAAQIEMERFGPGAGPETIRRA